MYINQVDSSKAMIVLQSDLRHMQVMAILKYHAIPCEEKYLRLGSMPYIQFPATYAKQVEYLVGKGEV